MENIILSTHWYIEPPIDFEHKQYVLYAYLQKVDRSFMDKKLSPYFLNLNKILSELNNFKLSHHEMLKLFEKEKYHYFDDNSKIKGYDNELIYEVIEIVDFSIPQIVSRIEYGKIILNKNRQILY
jgi:hypothetical protein